MNIDIDARGLSCPLPVVRTKNALEGIEEGDITVLIERSDGCQNVVRFAQSQGCTVDVDKKDGLFYMHIHKGKSEKSASPRQSEGVVVFITSDKLGTGDDQLGTVLIRAFINTLCNASPRPAKLLFINDGVKLTTEGSPALDDLQLLAIGGVEIFSCGTCLDYYKLKDKLKVGLVTNMYDTVDSLLSADKIIKI